MYNNCIYKNTKTNLQFSPYVMCLTIRFTILNVEILKGFLSGLVVLI